jgi:beta-glucosidase
MTSFSDFDGVPATANEFLLRRVLREEWGFRGLVVSDWASIEQLSIHGLTANDRESALAAVSAGVDMEMATGTYARHLAQAVESGELEAAVIDERVGNILRVKFALGLFDHPYTDTSRLPPTGNPEHLEIARRAALQSLVLLENRGATLPLDAASTGTIAVIGPLADDPYEQLGTWIFDGDPGLSRTPLQAIRETLGDASRVRHVRAMDTTRSRSTGGFAEAVEAAAAADAVVVFLGEESILSGEAHSRADISLPGNQADLVAALRQAGKPLVAVVMAGRPLTLANVVDQVDALLFAWHPGSMGGPAIADVLFGREAPSGKLPVTFPRMVGQVPIYYAHKNTGKPATPETYQHIDDIPRGMPQASSGWVSSHLDAGITPQYPFGFGLSYTEFRYSDISVSAEEVAIGEALTVAATVANVGSREATEVVQLYLRDRVGSVTRPVRELKGFQRIRLAPGESWRVEFELGPAETAFYGRDMQWRAEPGAFDVWIGGSSQADLQAGFRLSQP